MPIGWNTRSHLQYSSTFNRPALHRSLQPLPVLKCVSVFLNRWKTFTSSSTVRSAVWTKSCVLCSWWGSRPLRANGIWIFPSWEKWNQFQAIWKSGVHSVPGLLHPSKIKSKKNWTNIINKILRLKQIGSAPNFGEVTLSFLLVAE